MFRSACARRGGEIAYGTDCAFAGCCLLPYSIIGQQRKGESGIYEAVQRVRLGSATISKKRDRVRSSINQTYKGCRTKKDAAHAAKQQIEGGARSLRALSITSMQLRIMVGAALWLEAVLVPCGCRRTLSSKTVGHPWLDWPKLLQIRSIHRNRRRRQQAARRACECFCSCSRACLRALSRHSLLMRFF